MSEYVRVSTGDAGRIRGYLKRTNVCEPPDSIFCGGLQGVSAPSFLKKQNGFKMILDFGKYNGRMISDVPNNYLQWLASNVKNRQHLETAIREEMNARGIVREMDPSEQNLAYFAANRDQFPLPCEPGKVFHVSRWNGIHSQ